MTAIHRILLLIVALSLISCASPRGFPERTVSSDEELKELKIYYESKKVDEYSVPDKTDKERMRIRNEIINARIAAIDIQFSLFQQKLHQEGVGLNIGSDAVILGLGAAGALASGGTSQVLSAASAAVTGLKGSIDKKLFFEQTMPALFAQMIAQRKKVLAKIRTGLTNSATDYPLQQGFADLEDYRYAGSIPGALATIVEDAGTTSAKATEKLDKILTFKMDAGAVSIERWLGPLTSSGEFDSEKVKKIKACWKKTGVPESTLFSDFIFEPTHAAKRLEVRECVDKP